MFARILYRKIYPSSFQVLLKTVFAVNIKRCNDISPICTPQYAFTKFNVPRRFYTEQMSPEEITVDYEYVKKATVDRNIFIVDVREPDEIREYGKIPNSINIPLGEVSAVFSKMSDTEFEKQYRRPKPSEETEIIFYCMIGKRSGMAQQNVLDLGYKNAKNYLGSWTEWGAKLQSK